MFAGAGAGSAAVFLDGDSAAAPKTNTPASAPTRSNNRNRVRFGFTIRANRGEIFACSMPFYVASQSSECCHAVGCAIWIWFACRTTALFKDDTMYTSYRVYMHVSTYIVGVSVTQPHRL